PAPANLRPACDNRPHARTAPSSAGFTLVELVTVIMLVGILGLVAWRNLSLPILAFDDSVRRGDAVGTAGLAVERISRELRLALPNSVRVSPDGAAIEFLRTSASGRYRLQADPADAASDPLDLAAISDSFQVLGDWTIPGSLRTGSGLADCLAGSSDCLAIYNTGSPADCGAQAAGSRTSAWCGDNLAGITAADPAKGLFSMSRASAGTALPLGSPEQRFFVVDTAVSFVCSGGELRRYSGYGIESIQTVPPAGPGILLADDVGGCRFGYEPGSSTRAGLVSLQITISYARPGSGAEQVSLQRQVHVPNTP
ncbi:MAG: type II secretion system protein J, partial [Gammaproteobacteria bacterium]